MTKGEQTVAKAVDQASKYWQTHREEMEHNNITLQDAQDRAATVAKKFADLSQQVKLNGEAAHEWQSIWEQAGNGVVDIFGKVLFDGGSLFGGLADLAK